MKILLLEDDVKLASEIKVFFGNEFYQCDAVTDGLDFIRQSYRQRYQLFILDINVPGLNGIDVCKKVRMLDAKTPILMLTAYSSIKDKVNALNFGADDYLVKPFHLDELLARVNALLRRTSGQNVAGKAYTIADLTIDAEEMTVKRGGRDLLLTPKEYQLLELLAEAKGKIVSKQTIAEKVWGINFETGTNTIEVYISFLRNKVDKGFGLQLIHTRPGYGYYLKESK